jgi:hypothetical protein
MIYFDFDKSDIRIEALDLENIGCYEPIPQYET